MWFRRAGSALPRTQAAASAAAVPLVWSLIGEKAGDNASIRVVTDALGWPVEERRIAMRGRWVLGKPFVRASLHHVDRERSDRLDAPWPLIAQGFATPFGAPLRAPEARSGRPSWQAPLSSGGDQDSSRAHRRAEAPGSATSAQTK
jgi:hypothetical protein